MLHLTDSQVCSKVLASPAGYLQKMLGRYGDTSNSDLFPRDVVDSYTRQLSSPPRVHATCEDYRASAPGGVDLLLDEEDRKAGRKVKQPTRILWGDRGICELEFGHDRMLELWRNVCDDANGRALKDCGHYVPVSWSLARLKWET